MGTADDIITWADFRAREHRLSATGACSHPIRLHGQIEAVDRATGETATVYKTWTDVQVPAADGVTETVRVGEPLYVACGNRRESACPSCSQVYKRDARQLVRAGLAGGKGVPDTVAAHPCVFATLTAPPFGPVHARRMRGKTVLPCRPRRDHKQRRCPHGRDISCPVRHVADDPGSAAPMCPDCYDYQAAVLFNLHAGDLWRRFTTYLPRHLARLAGITGRQLRADLRIRYVKVAEYQAHGVVHFHAVIRLDAPGDDYAPPPARYTAALLCDAIALAAKTVRLDAPTGTGPRIRLGFGRQVDARPVRRQSFAASGQPLEADAVANYIAKYATKSADVPGLPDARIRHPADIAALRCPAHHQRMVATAWDLGARDATDDPRLRLWAHMLGYGGHFLTKSRRYSVTFGQLRGSGRTKTEAQCKLREIIRDHEDGQVTDGHGYTVAQAVRDWLQFGLSGRDADTVEKCTILASTHIIPALGARKLRELSADDVDRWLADKAKALSTSTLQILHSILRQSITRAQARDKVKRNVVLLCDIPRGQEGRPSKSLTFDQADALLAAAENTSLHAYIVVSLLTGARTEELRALTWSHVDLNATPPCIMVWRSVRAGGDTKTRKSRRTLELPQRCVDALRLHRERQDQIRKRAGDRWHDNDLVFASRVGTALNAGNVRRSFRTVAAAAGLDPADWTPRELRHSFVSLMSDAGVPIEKIARLVGHTGTTTTETVYRKQIRPVVTGGAEVMDSLFPKRDTDA